MKKIIILFLTLLLALSLIACGNEEVKEPNEIAKLYDDGFAPTMWTMSETTWEAIFQKEMSFDKVYEVTLEVTSKENEKINEASLADNSDEAVKEVVSYILGPVVEDITDLIPTDEEINKLVGKTLTEIEEMGYFCMGDLNSEDKHIYTYDNNVYSVDLELDVEGIKDWNDISYNELMTLKVKAAEFTGFSSLFLESRM